MKAEGSGMEPSAPFRLRDYQDSDFARLCEIDQECFPPAIACAARELQELVKDANAFAIVAEAEDGQVAGFVIASKPGVKSGHIVTLDVLPPFRRQGAGEMLLQSAEERLRKIDVERIVLETPMASGGAQALYRKLGFARVGFVKGYYRDGTDAWLMEKHLTTD